VDQARRAVNLAEPGNENPVTVSSVNFGGEGCFLADPDPV
jgi:hypothetical protein